MEVQIVEFSRPNKSVPWGFSIQGGREFGCPLSVLRVNAGSIAAQLGVSVGDFIVKINDISTDTMTHQQAILQIQNLNVILEIRKGQDYFPPPPPDSNTFNNSCSISSKESLPPPPPPQIPPPKPLFTAPLPPPQQIPPPKPIITAPTFGASSSNVPQMSYSSYPKSSQPVVSPKPKEIPSVTLDAEKVNLFNRKMGDNAPKPQVTPGSLGKFIQNNERRDNKDLMIQQTNQDKSNAICFVCKDHIKGSYIEANKKIYCSDHFCCTFCGNPIKSSQFIETKEGVLYCMEDFKNNVAPKCTKCNLPVVEEQIMALGKCWHSACFLCDHCKKPIPQGHFHVKEDGGVMSVYCERDYKEFYEIKCTGCAYPIDGDDKYLLVSGKNYHVTCFKK